jgi:hypothetical protein
MGVMTLLLISSTLIFGAITGLMSFRERELHYRITGQVTHGSLSLICFGLVGVAFWRFGWKGGVIDLGLLLIASNTAFLFAKYIRKRSSL